MVTHSTEATERFGSKELGSVVRAGGGLLLALAIVAGIGVRHLTQQRSGGVTTAVEQRNSANASSAEHGSRRFATRNETLSVYIVDSESEAMRLRGGIAERDHILAGFGPILPNLVVLTLGSPEEESAVLQAFAELDAIRVSIGLPGLAVVDLRTSEK